jgi:hypothetical protein
LFQALSNFLSKAGASLDSSLSAVETQDIKTDDADKFALLGLVGKSNNEVRKKSDKPETNHVSNEDAGKNLANLFNMQNNVQG